MTTPRPARSVAFLTTADRRLLLPFVTRWAHHARHGRRREHQGRAADCHACAALTDSLMQEVGARAAREGWASAADVVRDLRRRADVRQSMLQDARRRYLGELRLRPRPDRDAKEWFRPILEAAQARGALRAPARTAEKLVEWAIDFAQDIDQQAEPGSMLPFERLARSLSTHFGTRYTADDVRATWEDVQAACAGDPAAAARLDQLVLRHGSHADDLGFDRDDPDEPGRGNDERSEVRPLWTATAPGPPPAVVDATVADLTAWRAAQRRRPSADRQRAVAAERLRAHLIRRHPGISAADADRYLDEREPAFAELLHQVLAEAG